MTEYDLQTTRYSLNPALFVRRDCSNALLYARRPSPAFCDAHYSLSVSEVRLLRELDGTRTIAEALQVLQGPDGLDVPSCKEFAEWAVGRGILVVAQGSGKKGDKQFDSAFAGGAAPANTMHDGNRRQYPVFITFLPTLRCASQCSYCYLGSREERRPPIAFGRLTEVMDECRDLHIFQWRLTGGEVLLYPDLVPLLRELSARGMFLGRPISTKIAVSSEKLGQLLDAGANDLQFSLDSVDPVVVGAMVGRKARQSQDYLQALFRTMSEAKRLGFSITVRPTITRQNYEQIPAFVKAAASLGDITIVFGVVSTDGRAVDHSLALNQSDWRRTQDLVCAAREVHPGVRMKIKTSPNAEAFGEDDNIGALHFPSTEAFVESAYCPVNRVRLCVLPDGRATFCTLPSVRETLILGDLTHQSIEEVWTSRIAMQLAYPEREDFGDSPCRECEMFTRCHFYCGKCLALVADAHGIDNLHFPDPRCPGSPTAATEAKTGRSP